jgi:hypothetical protein
MILTVTESFVLTAGVLGHTEREIARQAENVADFILCGIGTSST